jgi:hypothetical protein
MQHPPPHGDASNPIIIDESSSGTLEPSTSNDARARKRKVVDEMSPPVGYRAIQPRRDGQGTGIVPSVLATRLGETRVPSPLVERERQQSYAYVIPASMNTVHPAPRIVPAPVVAPPPITNPTHSLRPPRTQRAIYHPKPGFPSPAPGHPDPATPALDFLPSAAPRPSLPLWTSIPTSDPDYQARLAENEARPALPDGCVPSVWASKRRGLVSALEYYGRPIKTTGGTVHVCSDVARAVILEGPAGEGYGFWGTGKSVGTFVVPFGNTRRRGRVEEGEGKVVLVDERSGARPVDGVPIARVPTPPPEIQENINKVLHQPQGSVVHSKTTHKQTELPEIDALLRAHRARTPIVVGISEDTTLVPFQLPRPFIILGFFWITDAWPEPTSEAWSDLSIPLAQLERPEVGVRWRFRFDWCTSGQAGYPWWESPRQGVTPLFMSMRDPITAEEGWIVDGPEADMTQTVRRQKPGEGIQEGWLPCDACLHESAEVYIEKRYCLHVGCEVWFYDRATRPPTVPPSETPPRRIILRAPRRCRRYGPDELGMTLRSPLPQESANSLPSDAGKTFWKGWVCPECGCANERKGWKGWDCEGCTNKWYPDRKIWSADELATTTTKRRRDPNLNTMPSLHPDIARFAGEVTMSSTIWRDGTKACFYGLRNKNELHLLMATPTASSVAKTDEIFQLLQVKDNVNFRRTPDQQPGTRREFLSSHRLSKLTSRSIGKVLFPALYVLDWTARDADAGGTAVVQACCVASRAEGLYTGDREDQ